MDSSNSVPRDVQWYLQVFKTLHLLPRHLVILIAVLPTFGVTRPFSHGVQAQFFRRFSLYDSVAVPLLHLSLPTYRMVEQELFPCLRHYGIRFYAYNPVSILCIHPVSERASKSNTALSRVIACRHTVVLCYRRVDFA